MRPVSFEEWYEKEVKSLIDLRRDELARGSAKDYAEYRANAGVITGLTMALDVFKSLAKTQRDSDE